MSQHGFGFGGICVSYLHVHKHTHTLTAPTHPPTHLSESGDARCAADVRLLAASAGVSAAAVPSLLAADLGCLPCADVCWRFRLRPRGLVCMRCDLSLKSKSACNASAHPTRVRFATPIERIPKRLFMSLAFTWFMHRRLHLDFFQNNQTVCAPENVIKRFVRRQK